MSRLSRNGLKVGDRVCFWRDVPGKVIQFGGRATTITHRDGTVEEFRAVLVRWDHGEENWLSSVDVWRDR